VLDRYLLAKTHELIDAVTADFEALDSPLAAAKLRDFADVLTNWYVRRSRDRFWRGVGENGENSEAFDTLYTVLETFTRLAAPMLPLVAERIWKDLTGGRSVHLTDWPDADEFPSDAALVTAMDQIRAVTSVALSLRKKAGLRVRLPLSKLTVVASDAAELELFEEIIRDELNVKAVEFVQLEAASAAEYGITSKLSINARAAGPRLGRDVQRVIKAARDGNWAQSDGVVTADGIELREAEYDLMLEVANDESDAALALLSDGGFVLLETQTTPMLEAEGLARDVVRAVQDARKSAGLDVSDRIRLKLVLDREGAAAVREFAELITAETLAVDLDVAEDDAVSVAESRIAVGDDSALIVTVEKAAV
jgi:isoleucyl-tRNA synthetase